MDLGFESATADAQSFKKRAACDECRIKKLKCGGEQPACSRCVRERIECVYSPPKRMGRPKKRVEGRREASGVDANGVSKQDRLGRQGAGAQQQRDSSTSVDYQHLDPGLFDSAFTPGVDFQPWTQTPQPNWDFDTSSGGLQLPSNDQMPSVPSLTPDSSSGQSPPTVTLPPELQSMDQYDLHPHVPAHSGNHHDVSAGHALDPSLSDPQDNSHATTSSLTLGDCACLSTMYLTLANLQTVDPAFPFPFALYPLRNAMQRASEVITCEQCPKRFITAVQNTQLLGTLLVSIAERFGKTLDSVTTEASRAESEGRDKKFRLAELSSSSSHLHTGGLGCAAVFRIDLSPKEWLGMAKMVVKAEVWGPSDGNECCVAFMSLLERFEKRHERWQDVPMPADFPKDKNGVPMGGRHLPNEDHVCSKMAGYSRRIIDGYDWS